MALWCFFHYLGLDPENVSKGADRVSAGLYWNNMRRFNILGDPNLTPAAVPIMAALGYAAAWITRPRTALALTGLFMLVVPASFTTMADRTDLVRYQATTLWIYYLAAGYLFAMAGSGTPKARMAAALAVAAGVFACAGAVQGLRMLSLGNEEIHEYRFLRETAAALPEDTTIHLPGQNRLARHLNTEFPDYVRGQALARDQLRASPGGRLFYIGLDCCRFDNTREIKRRATAAGLRKSCAALCPGRAEPVAVRRLTVPRYRGGFDMRYFTLGSRAPEAAFLRCFSKTSDHR